MSDTEVVSPEPDFNDHPAEQWIPVRFVTHAQVCDFCQFPIHKASPGRRVGERGTKAWFNRYRNVWECLGCRSEAMRADSARAKEREEQHGR